MVTRKPLPDNAAIAPNVQPPRNMEDMRQEVWSGPDSEESAGARWEDQAEKTQVDGLASQAGLPADVPNSLRPGNAGKLTDFDNDEQNAWSTPEPPPVTPAAKQPASDLSDVPNSLRPGGGAPLPETNPFKRRVTPASSQETVNAPPVSLGVPPSQSSPGLTRLNSNEPSNNPWQPALDVNRASPGSTHVPTLADEDTGKEVWSAKNDSAQPSRKPSPGLSSSFALVSLADEQEGSPAWDEVASHPQPAAPTPPDDMEILDEDLFEDDRRAWDDAGTRDKGKAPAKMPAMANLRAESTGDGWDLMDDPAPGQLSKQSTWENFDDNDAKRPTAAGKLSEPAPELPPRRSAEEAPPQPPRPAGGDKAETYFIKNIRWFDTTADENPRVSPILVQNANGPCPLVALVNALTLTTPAGMSTALVDVLRSREQVSLELLLDAVFDELMSTRRTDADAELPDVMELYGFLKGLHTGMNVNPRFIPTPELVTAFKRTSLTHLHPSERGDMIPGTFEDTTEMRYYAAFSIPLIHGWIPPKTDAVYEALSRRAESYEDVQNLLFREEELEEKLSNAFGQGLSEEEQSVYQDILTIKSFLSISATQLTSWGLEVIAKAMRPGSIAILFRNDHFSTLYRHPQTQGLLALVTDAGYVGHEEIVWESLVDVNGEHAEFFSGDFRLVGGAGLQAERSSTPGRFPGSTGNNDEWPEVGSSNGGGAGWTTVQGKRNNKSASHSDEPLSPTHEQEDADLAFALQLQEEEEERHRAAEARRKRESQLSEQFIEQQARQPGPVSVRGGGGGGNTGRGGGARGGRLGPQPIAVNQRRSSSGIPVTSPHMQDRGRSISVTTNMRARGGGIRPVVQPVRPLVPPAVNRPADEGSDDAPPSYEQAAQQEPYQPPAGHPAHPASSPDRAGSVLSGEPAPAAPRASGTLQRMAPGPPPLSAMGRTYRQGVAPSTGGVGSGGVGGSGRKQDCVIM